MTERLTGIEAITFDFGNTLVPVGREGLRRVVEHTADGIVRDQPDIDRDAFLSAWAEERERQFRENVPQFREVDLAERLVRVFARLRGMDPPGPADGWDDARASTFSDRAEVDRAIETYSGAFVAGLPPAAGVDDLLARLAADGWVLAILSNWPLAADDRPIRRGARMAGQAPGDRRQPARRGDQAPPGDLRRRGLRPGGSAGRRHPPCG